ncbi:MAG: adenylyl-sulfate kinase [Flavobacteriales bacterium]
MPQNNIHPTLDKLLSRNDKETLLNQKGIALWFTGFSGSGKTTLAIHIEQKLHNLGILTQVLDGDNVRAGLNNNLGFSPRDRTENIRRIAEVNKLFVNCGLVCINCFVSPTKKIRDTAREIIGTNDFVEIYVNASLEACEERDVKGLYKKARAGEIQDFTGINAPFEAPQNPEIEVKTDKMSIDECVDFIFTQIIDRIKK